jgi:hypothetical protein
MSSRVIHKLSYSRLVENSDGTRSLEVDRICGAGLFSNFTTLLWDLCTCRRLGYKVDRLGSGIGLECYKDRVTDDPIRLLLDCGSGDLDFWFFSLPIIDHFDHHCTYSELPYTQLSPYIERFFRPSNIVEHRLARIVSDYDINLRSTASICFRGTDKHIEIPFKPVDVFIRALYNSGDFTDEDKVLVQTDEFEARRELMTALGSRAFYLNCLPVAPRGARAVHLHNISNRVDFAITLLAVNLLLSRVNLLITHTGNMALWQHLYRGSSKRVVQV